MSEQNDDATELDLVYDDLWHAKARIEQLEARLDRAVTRGLEQVERIATLEAVLRSIIEVALAGSQDT